MKINKIGIFYNIGKEVPKKIITEIEIWSKKNKIDLQVYKEWPNNIPKIDIAISLGGDGTILKLGRFLAGSNIPVLGINLGRLGFLAEINSADILKALDDVVYKKSFVIQKRVLLEVSVIRNNKTFFKYLAVNDVVLKNGDKARVIDLDISVGDEHVAKYIGDGVIISTPTGSTAYSLASGGPIVYPNLPVLVISAICPHTLALRPLIVGDEKNIKIKNFMLKQDIILSIDGQVFQKVLDKDEIIIKKSKENMSIMVSKDLNYFEVLRNKLSWGAR